jgi:hypothetical protein
MLWGRPIHGLLRLVRMGRHEVEVVERQAGLVHVCRREMT